MYKRVCWLLFAASILLAACGGKKSDEKGLELVYVNWADGIAITNLAKVILEEEMGYEVDLQVADPAPVYASVAQGDKDAFLDAWLPVTHQDYMEKFGDKLVDAGSNFDGAQLGLAVPKYMNVNAIPDLKGKSKQYGRKIIGIDAGAGIMNKTEKAIEAYKLDGYELISSSGPAMVTGLKGAIPKKEPIVVTAWYPHWMFHRYDIKILDDPKNVYGKEENIHTVVRHGFKEEKPEVYAFFKKFKLSEDQLLELMSRIEDSDKDPEEVAMAWYKNNPQAVKEWLPAD